MVECDPQFEPHGHRWFVARVGMYSGSVAAPLVSGGPWRWDVMTDLGRPVGGGTAGLQEAAEGAALECMLDDGGLAPEDVERVEVGVAARVLLAAAAGIRRNEAGASVDS